MVKMYAEVLGSMQTDFVLVIFKLSSGGVDRVDALVRALVRDLVLYCQFLLVFFLILVQTIENIKNADRTGISPSRATQLELSYLFIFT